MIDWYRVDTSPRIKRVMATAVGLVLCGSLLGAACLARTQDPYAAARGGATGPGSWTPEVAQAPTLDDHRGVMFSLGIAALALVVSGGGAAIWGLMRELSQERWLALRTDGLVIRDAGREKRAPWGQIAEVRMDGTTIVVALASGNTWSIRDHFAGTTRSELGRRIAHVRRRALHGLLPKA